MPATNYIRVEREIYKMLYGDQLAPPQGHWVLFRWYHVGIPSKYWDPELKQAIGGPKWKYTTYSLRTTYGMGSSAGLSANLRYPAMSGIPGNLDIDERLYLIERCYKPKIGDQIFEYTCDYPDDPDEFLLFAQTYAPNEKYTIKNVFPARTDGSRIVYYLVQAKLDQGRV